MPEKKKPFREPTISEIMNPEKNSSLREYQDKDIMFSHSSDMYSISLVTGLWLVEDFGKWLQANKQQLISWQEVAAAAFLVSLASTDGLCVGSGKSYILKTISEYLSSNSFMEARHKFRATPPVEFGNPPNALTEFQDQNGITLMESYSKVCHERDAALKTISILKEQLKELLKTL